jgi:glycosyltransferase involved in cell wall biosynthesis
MIFFDVTKAGRASHRSGLTRVSDRLLAELGESATAVRWDGRWRGVASGKPAAPTANDWLLTPELFSPEERPGWEEFLRASPCRLAAIFHDAIPLTHSHITWPQSVARHPGYMKQLTRFDRVWAVSQASREALLGFWRWQGIERAPAVETLALGADFDAQSRSRVPARPPLPARLLCLGILEPRKNQSFLLDVCETLWAEGLSFELHLVGRMNPHFGKPIVARIDVLRRTRRKQLYFHRAASDAAVAELFSQARATVFPTIAEGCGLPLLESLWRGVPCVCSDLQVLRENADAGGCLAVRANDHAAWATALRRVLTDEALVERLSVEAETRPLPIWREAAATLREALN